MERVSLTAKENRVFNGLNVRQLHMLYLHSDGEFCANRYMVEDFSMYMRKARELLQNNSSDNDGQSVLDRLNYIRKKECYFDEKLISWIKGNSRALYYFVNNLRNVIPPGPFNLIHFRYKCFFCSYQGGIYDELILFLDGLYYYFSINDDARNLFQKIENIKRGYFGLINRFSYDSFDFRVDDECHWFVRYVEKFTIRDVEKTSNRLLPIFSNGSDIRERAEYHRSVLDTDSFGETAKLYKSMNVAWAQKKRRDRKANIKTNGFSMLSKGVQNKLETLSKKSSLSQKRVIELAVSEYYDRQG
ncbi:hypothetical protein L1D19_23335 [Vibrio natriegens]|uniref:hypothetical protein n=1 Tax=Vibrio natriegens TaxID=691 RepID=UPI001EFD4633|nr:hypothetical protein [Vibrio natriegens]MCG9703002.1 hypothetical protein [Vibrio natriegens]